jgi:hypothetical protein
MPQADHIECDMDTDRESFECEVFLRDKRTHTIRGIDEVSGIDASSVSVGGDDPDVVMGFSEPQMCRMVNDDDTDYEGLWCHSEAPSPPHDMITE